MNKRILLYLFLMTGTSNLLLAQSFTSEDRWWDDEANPDYEWTNANNWANNALPATTDDVFINNGFSANLASGDNLTVESVALGQDNINGADPLLHPDFGPPIVIWETSGHMTIESGATLTTTKGSHEGSDGFHMEGVIGNESTLIVDGTLNINSDASGDGLDIGAYTNVVVGNSATLNAVAKVKSGINTGDDITNFGTINITASSACTDGIKFSGPIAGSKIINKANASMNISGGGFMNYGINLNSAFTFDNFGTLTISGTLNNILEGTMTFNNYGTLAGNGIVNISNFDVDGSTFSPGTSSVPIGKITFKKPVNLSDVDLNIQINGAASYDQLEATATSGINITNAILNLSGTYTPVAGDVFTIINNLSGTPITGQFLGLPEGAVFIYKGINLTISYTDGSGNDVTLTFPAPLPVELISFNASVAVKNVKLVWLTATETNNDYFTVERSSDGRSFERLGTIQGRGTSTVLNEYAFLDKSPLNGLSYYRLKQTDFDGQFSYSDIEPVEYRAENAIQIYPTTVANVLNIEMNGGKENEITAVVRDLNGRVIQSTCIEAKENRKEISLTDLLPGYYFITLYNNDIIETFKFIKL